MRTIYEKEALFERLDAAVAELKEYTVGAVHRAELHQVEQQMFRQLQQVGRHGLETFVALSGTGYEAANPPLSEEGSPLEYKGTCGSLVKDHMEQSGMRWSIHGAQAILAQRVVVKNGDWNDFFTYYSSMK